MRSKLFLAFITIVLFSAFKVKEDHIVTIFMVGDSTMANKDLKGGNPERGWGHLLPGFFDENIKIDNYARNGRSSKSFILEGHWEKVLSKIKRGDYVFIQFGHNDQKEDTLRSTAPGTTYDDYLRRYVNETRTKGGIPVMFTSIVRRHFNEEGKLIDTHGDYLQSVVNIARELDVIFIDLNKITHNFVENLGDEKSKELFMWVTPATIAAHPEGKQDDTHLNVKGAKEIAWLAVEAITKKIPELKPYVRKYDYVVAKDGSGDFFTIQEAINNVPDYRKENRTTILVRSGIYEEKLIIPESKINVSLTGEGDVFITGKDYAAKKNVFGEEMSTSGSASCYIYAADFYAENITFENRAGEVGQAVACFVSGDRIIFKNCRFLGNQDTLYTYGKESRQYYEDCYIEGTVDFIFGWSTALFNRCVIHSKGNGYVTAPATDKGKKYGYVFINCKLTAEEGVDKVYLSRPWRPYAKAVFIKSNLGKHILPEGWDNWNKKEAEKTAFYAEYQNYGEASDTSQRVKYSRQLRDLKGYQLEDILAGEDSWNPVLYGSKLIKAVR